MANTKIAEGFDRAAAQPCRSAGNHVKVIHHAAAALAGHESISRAHTVLADDGIALAVAERGPSDAALTIVCAHGHCLDQTTFRRFIDIMTERWGPSLRVVTYDHRGHGRSGSADTSTYTIAQLARDLAAVLDTVTPVGPVILVGHSMGGMTILRYVREHPSEVGNRIVAIALIASSAGDLPAHGLSRTLRTPIIPWFTASARAYPSLLQGVRQIMCGVLPPVLRTPGLRSSSAGRWVVAGLEAAVRNRTRIETVAGFLPSLAALDEYAALEVLAGIPVAVVCGTHDLLTPLPHSVAIADRTGSAELTVVPGAGHMVITDNAETVAGAVDDLLDRVALAATYPTAECG